MVCVAVAAIQGSLPAGGLAPHETLALVVGAAMHDAEHPGTRKQPPNCPKKVCARVAPVCLVAKHSLALALTQALLVTTQSSTPHPSVPLFPHLQSVFACTTLYL
jgi:hypothetical protein